MPGTCDDLVWKDIMDKESSLDNHSRVLIVITYYNKQFAIFSFIIIFAVIL